MKQKGIRLKFHLKENSKLVLERDVFVSRLRFSFDFNLGSKISLTNRCHVLGSY